MGNAVFNISKGRTVEYYARVENEDPTAAELTVVLLKVAESDATLLDYDNLSSILAAAGNTEADFTNYARKSIDAVTLAALAAPDDANDRRELDMPDITWTSAGGASNNTLVKLLICYDDGSAGTDDVLVPVAHYDFAVTTNGANLTAQIDPDGFIWAQ